MCSKLCLVFVLFIVAVTVSGQGYGSNRRQQIVHRPVHSAPHPCPHSSYGPCDERSGYCPHGSTCQGSWPNRQCCRIQTRQSSVGRCPAPYYRYSGCSYSQDSCTGNYNCPQGYTCCFDGCNRRCIYVTRRSGGY